MAFSVMPIPDQRVRVKVRKIGPTTEAIPTQPVSAAISHSPHQTQASPK